MLKRSAMNDLDQQTLVFLTGSSRSGTTLMSNILHAHPKIISCPENGFFNTHFHTFKNKKQFTKRDVELFIKHLWIRKRLMQSVWNHNLDELKETLLESRSSLNFEKACREVYQSFDTNKPNASVFIDKNPSHINQLERIRKHFPQSKFIVMIRDHRDRFVSLSKLKQKARIKLLNIRGLAWNRHQLNALRLYQEAPTKILLVKYEDLLLNPKQELEKIVAFLDLEFDPKLLEHETQQSRSFQLKENHPLKDHFEASHGKSNTSIDPKNIGQHKNKLTHKKVRLLNQGCKVAATRLGYLESNQTPKNPLLAFRTYWIRGVGKIGHKIQFSFFRLPLGIQARALHLAHKILYS